MKSSSKKRRPNFKAQDIELVARKDETRIEWRFTYPDAARANAKRIRVEVEPAAGGTQLRISLAWEHSTTRPRRSILGLLKRPLVRFGIWMQLSQLSGGISRAFR